MPENQSIEELLKEHGFWYMRAMKHGLLRDQAADRFKAIASQLKTIMSREVDNEVRTIREAQ